MRVFSFNERHETTKARFYTIELDTRRLSILNLYEFSPLFYNLRFVGDNLIGLKLRSIWGDMYDVIVRCKYERAWFGSVFN